MMKMRLAALGLLLSSTALYAQSTTTSSVNASVQGALQAPTGFLTGGQVQVTGVGQGSVVLTRAAADFGLTAGAEAGLTTVANGAGGIPSSSSRMVTTFDFSREVETGGALVGIGNVVAQGESLGGIGIVGAASSNATRAGTRTATLLGVETPSSGAATTPTSAQGSMVADFTTTNTMQLTGTGVLFAGAQTLSIGERNAGISAGLTGTVAANATTIDLNTLSLDVTATPIVTSGFGAGFLATSDLLGVGGGATIDMNASNAGNGTVLVSGSTGGFFGQGTGFGATVAPTFSQVNGFFTSPNTNAAGVLIP